MGNFRKLRAEHDPRKGKYTILDNEVFFLQKPLSLNATAVYVKLLSLPPDWYLTQSYIANCFNVGTETISKAFNELRSQGYLNWEEIAKGRFGRKYTIKEITNGTLTEEHMSNSDSEIPRQKNHNKKNITVNTEPYINTNDINTNNINTKKYNKKSKSKLVSSDSEVTKPENETDALDEDGNKITFR